MFERLKKILKNSGQIILPSPAQSKEEAEKRIRAAEATNNAFNIANIMNNDTNYDLDLLNLISNVRTMEADAEAKRYNIPNNIHMFDDPRLQTYKAIGKDLYNWGKNVKQSWPTIRQIFLNKLDNDLNIPRMYNEALHASPEINATNPAKSVSIDSDGNINTTLYGQVEKNVPAYQGYINPVTNDNRIFSREDIGSFNTNEYLNHEPAIMAQWGKIGIPSNSDLEHERLTNNGTVFVQGYTRSDGTKVKSYYRAA